MLDLIVAAAVLAPGNLDCIRERARPPLRRPAWHWLKGDDGDWFRVWGTELPDGTIFNPQYERPRWPFA